MNEVICGICRDEDSCDFETRCGHFFHESCLNAFFTRFNDDSTGGNTNWFCPYCRGIISKSCKIENLIKIGISANFSSINFEKSDIIPMLEAAVNDQSLPSRLIIEKCFEMGWKINNMLDDNHATLIHIVADAGHPYLLEFVISLGADVNMKDKWTGTPLHYACKKGHLEMSEALISNGADLNVVDRRKKSPLHYAVSEYDNINYLLVKLLLENNANIDNLDDDNMSALMVAVEHWADIKTIELFVEHGALKSSEELNECYLLAFRPRDMAVVNYFIEKGANILCKSKMRVWKRCQIYSSDRTGLHGAAEYGHFEFAKYLVDCGADLNAAEADGNTPLIMASKRGHLDIVKLLVSHCADLNACHELGWSAFQIACDYDRTEVAEFLFDSGADVTIKTRYQHDMFIGLLKNPNLLQKVLDKYPMFNAPVLHAICEVGDHEMLVDYINRGYNLNSLNYKGETPLFYAKKPEIVKELLGRSVDLNARSEKGLTPLLKACKKGNWNLFKKLIKNEAVDIHASCNENKNALHYAVEYFRPEMVKILIKMGVDVNQLDSDHRGPVNYILDSYFDLSYKDRKKTESTGIFLEMISDFKNYGGKFTFGWGYEDCFERYREDPVSKAFMEAFLS